MKTCHIPPLTRKGAHAPKIRAQMTRELALSSMSPFESAMDITCDFSVSLSNIGISSHKALTQASVSCKQARGRLCEGAIAENNTQCAMKRASHERTSSDFSLLMFRTTVGSRQDCSSAADMSLSLMMRTNTSAASTCSFEGKDRGKVGSESPIGQSGVEAARSRIALSTHKPVCQHPGGLGLPSVVQLRLPTLTDPGL